MELITEIVFNVYKDGDQPEVVMTAKIVEGTIKVIWAASGLSKFERLECYNNIWQQVRSQIL